MLVKEYIINDVFYPLNSRFGAVTAAPILNSSGAL